MNIPFSFQLIEPNFRVESSRINNLDSLEFNLLL